jgi:hypothetical protein
MLSAVMYGAYVVGYVVVWRKVAGALVERVRQREQRSPWVEEYVRCALLGVLYCLVWPPIAVIWWVRRKIVRLDAGEKILAFVFSPPRPLQTNRDRVRNLEAEIVRLERQVGLG